MTCIFPGLVLNQALFWGQWLHSRKEKPLENWRSHWHSHPTAGGVSNRKNFQKLPFIPLVARTLLVEILFVLDQISLSGSITIPFVAGQVEGSRNGGTPKSSIFVGFSLISHPFGGTPMTSWKPPSDTFAFLGPQLHPRNWSPAGHFTTAELRAKSAQGCLGCLLITWSEGIPGVIGAVSTWLDASILGSSYMP